MKLEFTLRKTNKQLDDETTKERNWQESGLVGVFWAAVLWEAAKQLFGYYLHNFAAFGKIYGAYALVVVVASGFSMHQLYILSVPK